MPRRFRLSLTPPPRVQIPPLPGTLLCPPEAARLRYSPATQGYQVCHPSSPRRRHAMERLLTLFSCIPATHVAVFVRLPGTRPRVAVWTLQRTD